MIIGYFDFISPSSGRFSGQQRVSYSKDFWEKRVSEQFSGAFID